MRTWLCLLIGCFLLAGCGYVSTSSYLQHIKSVTIPRITIDAVTTTEIPDITEFEDELTTAVRRKFSTKWKDGPDAQLEIEVHDFVIEPIRLDANNNPEQLRMSLVLSYDFRDQVKNKTIDNKEQYVQNYDFYIVEGREEPPETPEAAMDEITQELADDLYNTLAEQW